MRNWRVPITFTLSLDGVVTSWSEGVRAVLGYDASEFIGQRFELIFTDEDVLSGVPERLLSTALEDGSAALAGWRLDKDGERRFTRGELTSLYGTDDEIVGLAVVFLPFGTGPAGMRRSGSSTVLAGPTQPAGTSVSSVAGEHPESELFSEVIAGLDERFYVLDDELRIVFVNKVVEEAWGRSYEELVGQSFIELFPHLQDTAFLSEHVRVANEGVSSRFESTSTITNKRVEVSIYPNVRGGVSVLIRDPFERSEPDQGMLSNERLAEAYAALEIALIEWEPEQGSWEESQTTPDIFGLEPKSRLGSRQAQLDLVMPADVDRYVQNVTEAIAAGTTWSHQYRIVRPHDGEVAWLEEFGSPIQQSEPPRYSVLAWDITSTKLIEERMRSSQRRLQQELAADRRLREIMSRPASAGGPEVALAEVLSGTVELFAVNQATMRLFFEDEGLLKIVAQHRFGAEYLSENEAVEIDLESIDERFDLGAGGGGSSDAAGAATVGNDVVADGGYRERWAPLVGSGGHVIGAMALHWRRPWKFSSRDEHDLLVLTRQAAGLAEAYLNERLARERMDAQRARADALGAELLESEVRFRRAFEVGPVAACITTVDEDRFLEINSGYLRVTGYDPAEVIGRNSRELGQWSSPADQAKIEAAFKSGSVFHELELKLRTKEGHIRDVLLSGQQITYDGRLCWLKMFNDVTEQHRSQEELMNAIHEVMSDTSWLGQSVVQKLAEMRGGGIADDGEFDLTARERQVLELVAAGHDDKEIATELGISQKTVRNHLANTYSKVNVHSRSEAIVWARDRGLVTRG